MGFSREKPSKHLTVFSPETVNIKKVANLTANTKNYRQITLNTKPHSDPRFNFPDAKMSKFVMFITAGYLCVIFDQATMAQEQKVFNYVLV